MKKIRDVLIKLQGNVILLQDDHDPSRFFPRFNLMKTSSFANYDSSKHEVLRQLHDNYFYHSHEDLWIQSAKKTLPVLMNATQMLMCGEDLGFVPSCVPPILGELGVIGLRIQRMPGPEAPAGALHYTSPPFQGNI
jgi:4-alpha-glucanotransferase